MKCNAEAEHIISTCKINETIPSILGSYHKSKRQFMLTAVIVQQSDVGSVYLAPLHNPKHDITRQFTDVPLISLNLAGGFNTLAEKHVKNKSHNKHNTEAMKGERHSAKHV